MKDTCVFIRIFSCKEFFFSFSALLEQVQAKRPIRNPVCSVAFFLLALLHTSPGSFVLSLFFRGNFSEFHKFRIDSKRVLGAHTRLSDRTAMAPNKPCKRACGKRCES